MSESFPAQGTRQPLSARFGDPDAPIYFLDPRAPAPAAPEGLPRYRVDLLPDDGEGTLAAEARDLALRLGADEPLEFAGYFFPVGDPERGLGSILAWAETCAPGSLPRCTLRWDDEEDALELLAVLAGDDERAALSDLLEWLDEAFGISSVRLGWAVVKLLDPEEEAHDRVGLLHRAVLRRPGTFDAIEIPPGLEV